MSILGNIFNKIFHRGGSQPGAAQTTQMGAGPATASGTQTPSAPQPQGTAAAATAQPVDIEQVLDGMASKNAQKLNWRTSIVDLMKLVGMESSLQERKELADELGYTGDKNDSATMNIWLHKQVMKKMQENGGKVPASLMD